MSLVLAALVSSPVLAATIEELQRDYLSLVRAPQAHQVTKGEGMIVAVMDSGVEADHPDLAGAVLPGISFEVDSPRGQVDTDGHGTRMAGVIAARGGGYNNALGIAPRAKILPIALPGDATIPSTAAIVNSIRYAADHGAKVLSMSLSMPEIDGSIDRQIVQAIAYAQAKDVVVVVASGNRVESGSDNILAKLPGVVAVSGVDSAGVPWSGGSTGMYIALAAPAVDVVNVGARSVHASGFSRATGTSESAAIVSGVAALVRAKYPDLNAANVINRLIRTAQDKGPAGRDAVYGFGIVDAHAAVTASVAEVRENPLGAPSQPISDPSDRTPQQTPRTSRTPAASGTTASFIGMLIPLAFLAAIATGIALVIRSNRRHKSAVGSSSSPHSPVVSDHTGSSAQDHPGKHPPSPSH